MSIISRKKSEIIHRFLKPFKMADDITARESTLDLELVNPRVITRLIDDINAYSIKLWTFPLFKIEATPLANVVLGCENDAIEFDIFCASLGVLIDCLDGKSIKSKISNADLNNGYTQHNCRIIEEPELIDHLKIIFSLEDDITFFEYHPLQSIQYLSIFLKNKLDNIDEVLDKLRKLRKLRNIVPIIHTASQNRIENALQELNIEHPIPDYKKAGQIILKEFIDFLEQFKLKLYEENTKRNTDSQ